ncbi:hypothetical protein KJY73_20145 [Bowmanella sp. Y26]|uniref:hypothetical protein n=1 Tax=Bowmanella yangjiangensis TaxID=2811230 RepID=UPI001BDD451C|nr:hypothetical protein [Bowmanella yangjiangensis]MBT1065896.1 hypothetical protein [Bowmanella yangjiangensis]
MRLFFPLALALFICIQAKADIPEHTKDGRMGTKCMPKCQGGEKEYCIVSITQLAITPERFNGKLVRVIGKLRMQFEVTGLKYGEHQIWVQVGDFKKYAQYDSRTVQIEGTFNALNFGHLGMWDGAIENVESIRLSD